MSHSMILGSYYRIPCLSDSFDFLQNTLSTYRDLSRFMDASPDAIVFMFSSIIQFISACFYNISIRIVGFIGLRTSVTIIVVYYIKCW